MYGSENDFFFKGDFSNRKPFIDLSKGKQTIIVHAGIFPFYWQVRNMTLQVRGLYTTEEYPQLPVEEFNDPSTFLLWKEDPEVKPSKPLLLFPRTGFIDINLTAQDIQRFNDNYIDEYHKLFLWCFAKVRFSSRPNDYYLSSIPLMEYTLRIPMINPKSTPKF